MWHKVYLNDLFGAETFLFFLSLRARRHIVDGFPLGAETFLLLISLRVHVAIVGIPRAILMGLIFLFQPLIVSFLSL